jgi:hypothetical protein
LASVLLFDICCTLSKFGTGAEFAPPSFFPQIRPRGRISPLNPRPHTPTIKKHRNFQKAA